MKIIPWSEWIDGYIPYYERDLATIYKMIDLEFWQKRFKEYVSDTEWCKDILGKAGL